MSKHIRPDTSTPQQSLDVQRYENGPLLRSILSEVTPTFNCPDNNLDTHKQYTIQMDMHCTFENFVTGPCNRFAHAAAVSVSQMPGEGYNPLFIYGPPGVGKTHLLYAINNVLLTMPGMKTILLTCEHFINHYVDTMGTNSWDVFRNLYRGADAILMDDVHLFGNSKGSMEEFFHTFNVLYNARRQIVITSNCPPDAITSLEDRLLSRFKWGLLCGMDSPTIETCAAIVGKKAFLCGINLSHESLTYIAENVSGDIRRAEKIIAKLSNVPEVLHESISFDLISKVVNELSGSKKPVSIESILRAVSYKFNISISQLQSKSKVRGLILPRQIAMYLSRKLTDMSLAEIGGYLGGRDHTTVIYAEEKISKMSRKDKNLLFTLQKLEGEIKK